MTTIILIISSILVITMLPGKYLLAIVILRFCYYNTDVQALFHACLSNILTAMTLR